MAGSLRIYETSKDIHSLATNVCQRRLRQGSKLGGCEGEHSDIATSQSQYRKLEVYNSFGLKPTKKCVTFDGALLFVKFRISHSLGVLQTRSAPDTRQCGIPTSGPSPDSRVSQSFRGRDRRAPLGFFGEVSCLSLSIMEELAGVCPMFQTLGVGFCRLASYISVSCR